MKVQVLIKPKEDVLDPAGRVLRQKLSDMGYTEVSAAHVGKLIQLDIEGGDEKTVDERIKRMCEELLVKASIEEFEIKVLS